MTIASEDINDEGTPDDCVTRAIGNEIEDHAKRYPERFARELVEIEREEYSTYGLEVGQNLDGSLMNFDAWIENMEDAIDDYVGRKAGAQDYDNEVVRSWWQDLARAYGARDVLIDRGADYPDRPKWID